MGTMVHASKSFVMFGRLNVHYLDLLCDIKTIKDLMKFLKVSEKGKTAPGHYSKGCSIQYVPSYSN
jgi:hypothetical protein